MVADIDLKKAQKVCGDVPSHGRKLLSVQCDVSNRARVEFMVKNALAEFGRIDILVNDAAIYPLRPLEEIKDEK